MISNIATLLNYSTTPKYRNAEFQLPKGRPAVLEDGTVLNVYFDVQWEKIPDGAFKEEGLVEVNGTANVFGQNKDVKATIRVQKEKIELGSNIAPQARLSQDIEEAYQSDTLKAIVNGSKDFKTGNTPNPTCWSNYKNSQPENSNDSGKNDRQQRSVCSMIPSKDLDRLRLHSAVTVGQHASRKRDATKILCR